jgi:hypothetical protein
MPKVVKLIMIIDHYISHTILFKYSHIACDLGRTGPISWKWRDSLLITPPLSYLLLIGYCKFEWQVALLDYIIVNIETLF